MQRVTEELDKLKKVTETIDKLRGEYTGQCVVSMLEGWLEAGEKAVEEHERTNTGNELTGDHCFLGIGVCVNVAKVRDVVRSFGVASGGIEGGGKVVNGKVGDWCRLNVGRVAVVERGIREAVGRGIRGAGLDGGVKGWGVRGCVIDAGEEVRMGVRERIGDR